ncbi:MAG: hypothetical protein K5647_03000, partial [Clostridiales bacterium]|nr:hypothetical protein [Clostridiales bacterium]
MTADRNTAKLIRKSVCAALAALMVLCSFTACVPGGQASDTEESGSGTGSETEPAAPEKPFGELWENGDAVYTIVRPDADGLTTNIALALATALREEAGCIFTVDTDYVGWKEIPDRYEILVGKTNRPESVEVMSGLSAEKPFEVRAIGKRIVLAGLTHVDIAAAVAEFAAGYTDAALALDFVPKAGPESAVPAESGPV